MNSSSNMQNIRYMDWDAHIHQIPMQSRVTDSTINIHIFFYLKKNRRLNMNFTSDQKREKANKRTGNGKDCVVTTAMDEP